MRERESQTDRQTDWLTDWLNSPHAGWMEKRIPHILNLVTCKHDWSSQAVAILYMHTHIPVNLSKVCPSEFCLHTHCKCQTFCHWLCVMKHIEPSCSPFIWICECVCNATLGVTYPYTVLNATVISVCKMFSVSYCMVRWWEAFVIAGECWLMPKLLNAWLSKTKCACSQSIRLLLHCVNISRPTLPWDVVTEKDNLIQPNREQSQVM